MAYITRSQLLYTDYDWHAREEGDNPNLRGFPDNVLLARKEGYEVLAFINHIAKLHSWKPDNAAAGHHIERLLRQMPAHIRSRQNAYEWVQMNNWHQG